MIIKVYEHDAKLLRRLAESMREEDPRFPATAANGLRLLIADAILSGRGQGGGAKSDEG